MATNLVAKMGQNYLPPALITLSFQILMGYRYVKGKGSPMVHKDRKDW